MQNNYDNPAGNGLYGGIVDGGNKKAVTYAGFWVRAAAYLIDSVIVFAGLLIVRLLLSLLMSVIQGTALGGNLLFHYTLKDILLYICQVMYFILCTYFTGTTPGKKAMNLRVVNAEEGEDLTLLNVIYRETVGRFLCSLPVGIGYLIAGLDKEKRGIHDMLCDTRVVYARKVTVYQIEKVIRQNGTAAGGTDVPVQNGPYSLVTPGTEPETPEQPDTVSFREDSAGEIRRDDLTDGEFLNKEE